ncbi:hypothetical protein LQ318_10645 [Aliifodinibius salicampi]|uniref:NACHT domain-containing protein n=1 Tax=Fodinibius salicampi TaxID=1920655 RepID=A0ABT3PZV9_9BACT|nr:hypothetical protein [Fodinibius salicampi]MCW9713366.1 hypothetical protein [Fodinibius salicampi]
MGKVHTYNFTFEWHLKVIWGLFRGNNNLNRKQKRLIKLIKGRLSFFLPFLATLFIPLISWGLNKNTIWGLLGIVSCLFFCAVSYIIFFKNKISKKGESNLKFFDEVNFKSPGDEIAIKDTVKGILNSEKAQPQFVHVAPIPDEFKKGKINLATNGYCQIIGKPGEGKSLLAYHLAYRFRPMTFPPNLINRANRVVFQLTTKFFQESLDEDREERLIEEVLFELDKLPGNIKIIIVDDAHTIESKSLKSELIKEAESNNIYLIWIETVLYQEYMKPSQSFINIRFKKFVDKLVEGFYNTNDPQVNRLLEGNIGGIDEAKRSVGSERRFPTTNVNDVWHFNFIATKGDERLKREITKLNDAHQIVLFHIAAVNIIRGDVEVHIDELTAKFSSNQWIKTYLPTINDIVNAIHYLQSNKEEGIEIRSSFIKEYNEGVKTLHFRFSVKIIKEIFDNNTEVFYRKLISSFSIWLEDGEYELNQFISVFHECLNDEMLKSLLKENISWYQDFIKNPHIEKINRWEYCLRDYTRIFGNLDFLQANNLEQIVNVISDTDPSQFQVLGEGLRKLNQNIEDFYKFFKADNWRRLAKQIEFVSIEYFDKLGDLLRLIGRSNQINLLKNVDWSIVEKEINKTEIQNFDKLFQLMRNLPNEYQKRVISSLNLNRLVDEIKKAKPRQLGKVAYLFSFLDLPSQSDIIQDIDWSLIGKKMSSIKLQNVDQLSMILKYLGPKEQELILEEINWASLAEDIQKMDIRNVSKLSAIIGKLNPKSKSKLFSHIRWKKFTADIEHIEINRLHRVTHFLNLLDEESKDKIFKNIDLSRLIDQFNSSKIYNLEKFSSFLASLNDEYRNEFINSLDWDYVVSILNNVNAKYLSSLATFIRVLGKDRRQYIFKNLEWDNIINELNDINIRYFNGFYNFVRLLDEEHKNFIFSKLDKKKIANKINNCSIKQFNLISLYFVLLNKEQKYSLFETLDWDHIAAEFQKVDERTLNQAAKLLSDLEEYNVELLARLDLKNIAKNLKPSYMATNGLVYLIRLFPKEYSESFAKEINWYDWLKFVKSSPHRELNQVGVMLLYSQEDRRQINDWIQNRKQELIRNCKKVYHSDGIEISRFLKGVSCLNEDLSREFARIIIKDSLSCDSSFKFSRNLYSLIKSFHDLDHEILELYLTQKFEDGIPIGEKLIDNMKKDEWGRETENEELIKNILKLINSTNPDLIKSQLTEKEIHEFNL